MARGTALICLLAVSSCSVLLFASKPASPPSFIKYRDAARTVPSGALRRPLPYESLPIYYERSWTADQSRQGTSFVVDPKGAWATAGHVTDHCAAIRFVVNAQIMPPVAAPAVALGEDISLITAGLQSTAALSIASGTPLPGATGYHMGFPMGSPGLVGSRLLGKTSAVRHAGQNGVVLAWLEEWRTEEMTDELDGLSGGPVLNAKGQVVGIVSMASERRGRILTAMPAAISRWLSAEGATRDARYAAPIADRRAAVSRLQFFINHGLIRQVYCDARLPPRQGY